MKILNNSINRKIKYSLIIDDGTHCELRTTYKFNKKGEHYVILEINDEDIDFSYLFCNPKGTS